MDSYLKKVYDFCQEYGMLPQKGSVIACVSGGADSMCLLHILHELSSTLGFRLCAAHFNHNLRGAESDGDEDFVRLHCQAMGIELLCGSGFVAQEAERSGCGIEEMARLMRYEFFHQCASKIGGAKIATAHNADDNLETVLLRIARGTGLLGLGGIPPVRDDIIRPVLCLTRDEIELYNSHHQIPSRVDSTNLDEAYSRNKLRHRVMPVLRELNPAVSRLSVDMCRLLRSDETYLQNLAQDFLDKNFKDGRLPAAELLSLPYPVSSRVIRAVCGTSLTSGHVAQILELAAAPGSSRELCIPGMSVNVQYGNLVFGQQETAAVVPETKLEPGSVVHFREQGFTIRCFYPEKVSQVHKSFTTFLFKSSAICGNILVRSRRTGDSIRLNNKSGSKSLKKLFIDKKIPAYKRASIPVICDGLGPIAIPGIGCDVRVIPSPGEMAIKVIVEEINDL